MFLSAVIFCFAACLVLTPIAGALARRFGFLDRPDSDRKLHIRATPLGGGVALFVSLTLAIAVAYTVPNSLQQLLQHHFWTACALFQCCAVVVAIGLIDDGFGLHGWHKLLGQIVATAILVTAGLFVDRITIFQYEFALGYLAFPFTLLWLVGAMNSINLLDGIDGLASSVGIVLSVTVSILGLINGHHLVTVAGLALAGSLTAFACFNFPPAKIYLGDAGSLLIGLFVGALTLRATSAVPATMAIVPALAVWTIPVFDTTVAIIRRKLAGRSIYSTDREHVHHRLLTRFSHGMALGIIVLCCATTCAGSLLSVHFGNDGYALLSTVLVIGTLVATRWFGSAELLQLVGSLRSTARGMAVSVSSRSRWPGQATQRVDAPQPPDLLKPVLTSAGETKLRPEGRVASLRQPVSTVETGDSWAHPKVRDQVAGGATDLSRDRLPTALEELTVRSEKLNHALQEQTRNEPAQRSSGPASRAIRGTAAAKEEKQSAS